MKTKLLSWMPNTLNSKKETVYSTECLLRLPYSARNCKAGLCQPLPQSDIVLRSWNERPAWQFTVKPFHEEKSSFQRDAPLPPSPGPHSSCLSWSPYCIEALFKYLTSGFQKEASRFEVKMWLPNRQYHWIASWSHMPMSLGHTRAKGTQKITFFSKFSHNEKMLAIWGNICRERNPWYCRSTTSCFP